jgi:hypothetical protein
MRPNERKLPAGHFLRHVQNQFPIVFFGLAQQAAKLIEEPGVFAGAAPSDIVTRLTLR